MAIIYGLIGYIILLGIWGIVSYLVYEFSKAIKQPWPINGLAGFSGFLFVIYQFYIFGWFLFVTYSLASSGQWVLALLFFFFLGGFIVSINNFLASLFVSIPAILSESYEEKMRPKYSTYNDNPHSNEELIVDPYQEALNIVGQKGMASTVILQNEMGISYAEANEHLKRMQDDGFIGPQNGTEPRDVYL